MKFDVNALSTLFIAQKPVIVQKTEKSLRLHKVCILDDLDQLVYL